jgi:PAS domain S-box-containing protein
VTAIEERAEQLYEDAPCGFVVAAPDGTIRHANRTFRSWVGRDAEQLLDTRFQELLAPGGRIYYETHYAPLLRMQGAVRELALELVRPDGGRLPVLVNATLGGDPEAMLVSVFDASERRRYERELLAARVAAEQRAAAATALEHVAEAVVLVDADGRVAVLNRAAERLLATEAAEAIGRSLAAHLPDWPAVAGRVPVAAADAVPTGSVVVPLTAGGRIRWVAAAATAAPDGIVYTLRDVTEERRVEHLRDDMVAIVSHELRTPLAGIFGAARTLASLRGRLDEASRDELVDVIAAQSERLARIVDQILLTERLDRGEVPVERLAFDLDGTVDQALAAGPWDPSRTKRVAPAEPVQAEGDPALFEQVLASLLDNAYRYSPPGSEIRVETARTHGHARVSVANAGAPIPPEARGRIFERFLRVDATHVSGRTGTGLGLYIAQELTTRMRGRLGLADDPAETRFFVDLPLAR